MKSFVSKRLVFACTTPLLALHLGQAGPLHAQGGVTTASSVVLPVTAGPVAAADLVQAQVHLGTASDHEGPEPVTWASQPIRIGVLDFRTLSVTGDATEGKPGTEINGAGTAIADALTDALRRDSRFQIVRIDLRSVSREDVAGAVRAGHGQNVDAVLVGDLDVVAAASGRVVVHAKGAPAPVETEVRLHAGLIDTHSGELLLTMDARSSDAAEEGRVDFAAQRVLASFDQETTPHKSTTTGPAGVVLRVDGSMVTVAMPAGMTLRVGDHLTVFAQGLTKDLGAGDLTVAHGLRAGSLQIVSVAANTAEGRFEGQLLPQSGDLATLPAAQ